VGTGMVKRDSVVVYTTLADIKVEAEFAAEMVRVVAVVFSCREEYHVSLRLVLDCTP
jgi:hypothetical protein